MDIKSKFLERFKKDYSLPIPLSDPRYFDYYLKTIDKYFQSIEKFNTFLEVYNENFLDNSMILQNKIIKDIQNSDFYQFYLNWNIPSVNFNNLDILYRLENENCWFVKIDLVKANYQALKYVGKYNKDISLLKNTYEEFIQQYTPYKYFQESKKFRQVIFGSLNPKRQQKIQKLLMNQIYSIISENALLNDLVLAGPDELIFKINENFVPKIKQHLSLLYDTDIDLHIEPFQLKILKSKFSNFYICEYKNKVKFKHVPLTLFMQVYKKYINEPLQEEDLLFFDGNFIAKYIEELIWIN